MNTMKQNPNSLDSDTTCFFQFEFPKPASEPAHQHDVVFCGKVLIPKTEQNPFLVRSESCSNPNSRNGFSAGRDLRSGSLQSPAARDNRLRRSSGGFWRRVNRLFGVVKFPVQMELSDMKKRQQQLKEHTLLLTSLPEQVRDGETVAGGARKNCWRRWRLTMRKGQSFHLLNAAAPTVSLGCFPLTVCAARRKKN